MGGSHRGTTDALAVADPADRIPWFGPPMGILSFVSARLMETWAHAQDVADALGSEHQPTDRLHHVAHLGVRARPFSYLVHDRSIPPGRIDITLTAPSGGTWSLGGRAGPVTRWSAATLEGSALDFCLVVTQRRHLTDTSLVVEGGPAIEWMSIAQAFAGPPGSGRAAGGRRLCPPGPAPLLHLSSVGMCNLTNATPGIMGYWNESRYTRQAIPDDAPTPSRPAGRPAGPHCGSINDHYFLTPGRGP